MKRTALALLAAASLSGCATMTALQPDYSNLRGVTLPAGDMTAAPVPMTLSLYEDYAELNRLCSKVTYGAGALVSPFKGFFGCAITWEKGCALLAPTNTAFEVLGHESLHCFSMAATPAKRLQLDPHFHHQDAKP